MDVLLTNREFSALLTSLIISLAVTTFCFGIGGWIAFWHTSRLKQSPVINYLMFLNLLIPPFFHALAWQNLVNLLIQWEVLPYSALNTLRTVPGVIGVLITAYIPIAYFIFRSGLANISSQIIAAAEIYQTKKVRIIKKILLPQLKPAVITTIVIIFLLTFNTFDVAGFYEVNVYPTEIFSQFSAHFNTTRALYLSLIPVIFSFFTIMLLIRTFWRNKPLFSLQNAANPRFYLLFKSNPLIHFGGLVFGVLIILGVILPVTLITYNSHFLRANFLPDLIISQDTITNTINLAYLGTPLLIITGIVGFSYTKLPWLRTFLLSLLALPGVTFGIIYIYTFNHPLFQFIYASPLILFLAYALRFLPYMGEIFYLSAQQIHPQILHAGRIFASDKKQFLGKIVLPLHKPAIYLAGAFAVWLIATELPITLLIQPPGLQTIMSRLFILLHYGAPELMNSLTLVLLILALIPVMIIKVKSIKDTHD